MSLFSLIVGVFGAINTHVVQPTQAFIWNKFEPHYEISKKTAAGILIAFNIISVSICMSAFMFGTFYFYNMPTVYHTFPLNFVYNRSCIENHKIYETNAKYLSKSLYVDECFPTSTLVLSSPKIKHLLEEGQPYSIVIRLQLPETQSNLEMGMFMVKMAVDGEPITEGKPVTNAADEDAAERNKNSWFYGKTIPLDKMPKKFSERPASMHHTSTLVKLIKLMFLWPLYAIELKEETQCIDVVLFEELILEKKNVHWNSKIQLDHPAIMVKSAHMDVTAQFKGIQYFLYRWPVLSFIIGTSFFFFPMLFVTSMMAYFCVWRALFPDNSTRHPARRRRAGRTPPRTLSCNDEHPSQEPDDHDAAQNSAPPANVHMDDDRSVSRRSSSSSIEMLGQAPTPESHEEMASSQISFVMTPSLSDPHHTSPPGGDLSTSEETQGSATSATETAGIEANSQLRLRGVQS